MVDILAKLVAFDAPTVTGNFDITDVGFGGATPKAVVFFATNHESANDPSATFHASWMCGWTDGTVNFVARTYSQNGVANTNVGRNQHTSLCIAIPSPTVAGTTGTNLVAGAFDSFIADGVRINFSVVNASQRRILALILGGADLQVKAGNTGSLGVGAGTITVSGVGFNPDAVFFSGDSAALSTPGDLFGLLFGIATNDGTQFSVSMIEADNVATGQPSQVLHNTAAIAQVNSTAATVDYTGIVGNFGADGFDIVINASTSADVAGYLALKFGGENFKLWGFDTRTATGLYSETTPGWTPRVVLAVGTNLEAVDAPQFNTALAGGFALGVATDEGEYWNARLRMLHAAATTETISITNEQFIAAPSSGDTGQVLADFVGMTALGFDVNYTAVAATAKKGFAFAIGGGAVDAGAAGTEITQGGLLALAEGAPIRATQGPLLVLAQSEAANLRVTQGALLTLGSTGKLQLSQAPILVLAKERGPSAHTAFIPFIEEV